MIRPKKLLSFRKQTTTTTMWVIVQFCLIFLQILATTIPPVHCDKPITTTSIDSAPAIDTHGTATATIATNNNNGDKLLHRVVRLTKIEDYALLSDESNKTRSPNAGSFPYNSAGYLASNGLRTLLKPQKFYTKQERFSAGPNRKNGNLVTLNLVTEPRKDICNGHCLCEKKNAFNTVTCDFQKNPRVSYSLLFGIGLNDSIWYIQCNICFLLENVGSYRRS